MSTKKTLFRVTYGIRRVQTIRRICNVLAVSEKDAIKNRSSGVVVSEEVIEERDDPFHPPSDMNTTTQRIS